ncbi:hypothetical protein [Microbacterium arborescens]|uniref:hypothetical protein n=1 Tax=Microbacterium arborescens TaxID=33883 RepID=UPI000DF7ED82|nr:hypothetical protein [Microbacterium arborescens]
MSESEAPPNTPATANGLGYGPIKPLAVRLNESTRTQLDIIAGLNDRTVTDECRLAIEAWLEKAKADPAIQARAQAVRDEIERAASTKRDAIAAIFDAGAASPKAHRPRATGS